MSFGSSVASPKEGIERHHLAYEHPPLADPQAQMRELKVSTACGYIVCYMKQAQKRELKEVIMDE